MQRSFNPNTMAMVSVFKTNEMKKIILVIAAVTFFSCTKEEPKCDCTYYSQEKTTANPVYKTTYQSTWSGCDEEDYGTSIFTHYDGTTTTTHTYVKCN